MLHDTSLLLFESTDAHSVLEDPTNADWLAVVRDITGELYDDVARRYHAALSHFRRAQRRPALAGQREFSGAGKKAALQAELAFLEERKRLEKAASARDDAAIFVEVQPDGEDSSLPECLRDFSKPAPPLSLQLAGAGRPPCDALCMMRAFLGASLLVGGDSPKDVHLLLHSNPTYARACGFLGRNAVKPPHELTSRRLPGLSTCEEFSEVMSRYGLWQLARVEQVRENLVSGVVEIEDTLAFDTTHAKANSHCDNVLPAESTKKTKRTKKRKKSKKKSKKSNKPKYRKVPRVKKTCECGKDNWEACEHSWVPTDQGAAIVVKGSTRIYWAHKASVVTFGDSEIPLDVRILQYAAEHDGKTLIPHLEVLQRDLPEVMSRLGYVLADDAYQGLSEDVARFGDKVRLIVPTHPSGKSKEQIAAAFFGINRFTNTGVPICEAGYRFEMRGRDITDQRYIWVAPNDTDTGQSVCRACPFADACLSNSAAERRHIRVNRENFPQINWDHPSHLAKEKKRYKRRTGVERAIKRLKVDLNAQVLTHRDGPRVQAHFERKLLILHILLKGTSSG